MNLIIINSFVFNKHYKRHCLFKDSFCGAIVSLYFRVITMDRVSMGFIFLFFACGKRDFFLVYYRLYFLLFTRTVREGERAIRKKKKRIKERERDRERVKKVETLLADWEQKQRSPTFLLEYWWMGQKAEEQKVSTVKTSTSIRDMTGKLSERKEIDIKMGLCLSFFKSGKNYS